MKTLDYKRFITPKIGLIAVILLYCSLTLSAIFDSNHFLLNLEPYPDALLYTLSAKEFLETGHFELTYNDVSLPVWVPTAYAFVLAINYLINPLVSSFLLLNTILGIITLSLLYSIIKIVTRNKWLSVGACLLYVLHGYMLWLPTLALSENLALPLMLLGIYFFAKSHKKITISKQEITGTFFSSIGLLFTRYAVALTSITILLSLLIKLCRKFTKKIVILTIGTGFIFVILFGLWLSTTPIGEYFVGLTKSSQFYGFQFTTDNSMFYLKSLLGFNNRFLWQTYSLTSGIFLLTYIIFIIYLLKNNLKIAFEIRYISLLFLSQLPFILIFYDTDSRYILYSIPLLIILFSLCLNAIQKHSLKKSQLLFIIGLCSLMFSQVPFYKTLIATNLLGRSTAVQYESVQHIKKYFNNRENNTLITALPPFLVQEYFPQSPSLLPLSHSQEFLQKKQYIWGDTINYDNLHDDYYSRILKGERVYISNAYVTHQQKVIDDFESIKQNFNLELVSTGCLDACNIYLLTNK